VNKDIAVSLRDTANKDEFWWLNNGVTVLASQISSSPGYLSITNPMIVNGLQTSYEIYSYFSTSRSEGDNDTRTMLVRVIKTTDAGAQDRIIKATTTVRLTGFPLAATG